QRASPSDTGAGRAGAGSDSDTATAAPGSAAPRYGGLAPVRLRELRERDEADGTHVPVVAQGIECAEERFDRGALGRADRSGMAHDRDRAALLRPLAGRRDEGQVRADDRVDGADVVPKSVAPDRRRLEKRQIAWL